jgi:hypothetical protein
MANILTAIGRSILTSRLAGGGTEPKNVGIGTGAGTAAAGDTTLFSEVSSAGAATGSRVAGTSSQQTTSTTNDTYQVVGTIAATAALSVTNAGLFDNSTIGAGNLLQKHDFAAIALAAGDQLALTFKTQFS